jgi:hypothetical protein
MTRPRGWCAPVMAFALSSFAARTASAEARRVAAVAPDAQLARALDIALSPWGTEVAQVQLDAPGGVVRMRIDRARTIARDTHADVVTWVSEDGGKYSAWIYDVASDRASLRELASAPPFDATTAAAVALSVKSLLRFTVVAPAPERFTAPAEEPKWAFGFSTSVAGHDGADVLWEPRAGLYGSYWPAAFGHRLGALLGLSAGLGVHVDGPTPHATTFSGTLSDFGLRAAVEGRVPLRSWLAMEVSMGAAVHFVSLEATIDAQPTQERTVQRFDVGFEPQVALSMALLEGLVRLAPWIGATILTGWQRFTVYGDVKLEVGPTTAEGGLRAEVVLP